MDKGASTTVQHVIMKRSTKHQPLNLQFNVSMLQSVSYALLKTNFISRVASIDTKCFLYLWDKQVQRAIIPLNLM